MKLASWQLGPVVLDFARPEVMAILNVSPESFSDGGELGSVKACVERAQREVQAGAVILDIGGESTRPGANPVNASIETDRVIPVVQAISEAQLPAAISVDTSKAVVARAALEAGAHLINDVSGLRDPEMATTVARFDAHLCLMHMRGTPQTMQQGEIVYEEVVGEVRAYLRETANRAIAAGVSADRIMVDPGIGFGKTTAHNIELTRALRKFSELGFPVLYGPSRKRFLGEITNRDVDDRDRATAAACALAVEFGAHVLRVHNTAACIDAVRVAATFAE